MASLTPRIDSLESGKNLIINGNFDFWQRGVTFNGAVNSTYTADRWRCFRSGAGAGTVNITQSTDVPTFSESRFKSTYSILHTMGTTATGSYQHGLLYKMEGYDYSNIHGKNARLQFWVKASTVGVYTIAFTNNPTSRNYIIEYTINAANTWEMKTVDLILDDVDGNWTFDNSASLVLFFNIGNSNTPAAPNVWQSTSIFTANQVQNITSGNTFQLSQVQLIANGDFSNNSAEIPFARAGKTVQEELTMCQRYFFDPMYLGTTENYAGVGQCFSATSARPIVNFPVTMRSAPTLSVSSASHFSVRAANGALVTATVISLDQASPNMAGVNVTVASGLVAGSATLLHSNTALGQISFASEL